MSGIYGFWHPTKDISQCKQDINRLMLWNAAYGNDTEELHMGEDFCLGCYCEKLSENVGRSTPVLKNGGKFAVIDAVLYNREELLERGNFESTLSDEELLYAYIERFGWDELKNVNGDFSGAVYEGKEKRLTLFRDHMGIRPLFYYVKDGRVVFSTDIRGIAGMEQVDVSVDKNWLWANVSGYGNLGRENTEFAHIFCVKPASYMTFAWEEGNLQVEKAEYWKLGAEKIRLSSEQAYIDKMRELITDSVKRRLDAVSGLVGAELSGGLDSGVIDILIHRLGRECVYFSWSASPEELPMAENDERLVIQDICKQEGITCNYGDTGITYSDDSIITRKMRKIGVEVNLNEGSVKKYVLPPYINTLTIGETSDFMNKNGAKVVFSGHGGDEGVSHRCSTYEMFYNKEYWEYFKYMWSTTKGARFRPKRMLSYCYRNLCVNAKKLRNAYQDVFGVEDLLKKEFRESFNDVEKMSLKFAYDAKGYVEEGGSRNRLDVVALLGAYSGARYLMPYMDYRVIDYAVSIPRHMYIKNGMKRYIFRQAFKDIMPESLYVLDRKESPSWNNLVKEPRTEEENRNRKQIALDMLDREFWAEYFDWDVVEQWAQKKSTPEDEMRDKGIFMCITNCFKFQNMVLRSREIGKEE